MNRSWSEHAESRTPAEREAHFQWWVKRQKPYNQAITDAGEVPWHEGDEAKRRELFFRRYRSQAPPP